MPGRRRDSTLVALALAVLAVGAGATDLPGIEQRLGAVVPATLTLIDSHGRTVQVRDLLAPDRPGVLVLGYLGCPGLCGTTLRSTVDALALTGLDPARDYRALFVSIDPRDGPELAASRLAQAVPAAQRPAWRFLTGAAAPVSTLARTVGFRYTPAARHDEYLHPAGIVILTPQASVSSYLMGVGYGPEELRAALRTAAAGRTGSLVERVLLYCHGLFLPAGSRSAAIWNGLRAAALLFAIAFAAWLWRGATRRTNGGLP